MQADYLIIIFSCYFIMKSNKGISMYFSGTFAALERWKLIEIRFYIFNTFIKALIRFSDRILCIHVSFLRSQRLCFSFDNKLETHMR